MSERPQTVSADVKKTKSKKEVLRIERHCNLRLRLSDNHSNKNIDKSRINKDIIINDVPRDEAIHSIFDKAVENYNKIQKRNDRKITDISKKLFDNQKTTPVVSFIFSFGNSGDYSEFGFTPSKDEMKDVYKSDEFKDRTKSLVNFGERLPELFPFIEFYHVSVHTDEINPHMHALGIPWHETPNQKLERNIGFNPALADCADKHHVKYDLDSKGRPSNKSVMRNFLHGFIEQEMVNSYQAETGYTIKLAPRKQKRKGMHVEAFKELMKPYNEFGHSMVKQYKELQELKSSMIEYNEQMKDVIKQLKDLIDEDKQQQASKIVDSIDLSSLDDYKSSSDKQDEEFKNHVNEFDDLDIDLSDLDDNQSNNNMAL